jgi:hypothetical protein
VVKYKNSGATVLRWKQTLPVTSYVNLGALLTISVPISSSVNKRIIVLTSQDWSEDLITIQKMLRRV